MNTFDDWERGRPAVSSPIEDIAAACAAIKAATGSAPRSFVMSRFAVLCLDRFEAHGPIRALVSSRRAVSRPRLPPLMVATNDEIAEWAHRERKRANRRKRAARIRRHGR